MQNKATFSSLIYCLIIGLLVGCAATAQKNIDYGQKQYWYKADPSIVNVSNEFYDARIIPIFEHKIKWDDFRGCIGFDLSLDNKTDKELELDWNKTFFIDGGQTNGGFMFEGIVYSKRNNPKQPDIIFSQSPFSKRIYPNNFVDFEAGNWWNKPVGEGDKGIYLTVNVDGQPISEKLILTVSRQ